MKQVDNGLVSHIKNCGDVYKVELKNGETILISFIGEQLKKIFDDYNVKYEIIEDKK